MTLADRTTAKAHAHPASYTAHIGRLQDEGWQVVAADATYGGESAVVVLARQRRGLLGRFGRLHIHVVACGHRPTGGVADG